MIESYQKDLLKDFNSWFETLVEIANKTKDTSSLPKLEVSLRSGVRYLGNLIGFQKSENENKNLLMLFEEADLYAKSGLHLVLCSEIVAISLVDPKSFLRAFSQEKSNVSELELRRKTKLVEEQLEQLTSQRFPISLILETISESDRNHVLQIVEVLTAIFESLTKEEMDKNIVLSNISSLEIQVSKTAQTTLENKHLTIVLSKTPDLILANEQKRLLDSIEKAL